jgi:hypothetical protein
MVIQMPATHVPVWALDPSSFQLWLLGVSSSHRTAVVDYYSMLGLSAAADESEINTAYRRLALSCHPDKIPSSDDDEVTSAKIKRFRALGDAKTVLLDPERRAAYDELRTQSPPSPQDTGGDSLMSLTEAYAVWAAAVLSAFKRSNSDNATAFQLVWSLGIPSLMIVMGGRDHGGRLCMTLALLLVQDSLDDELARMSDDDMRIFRQAVMVLA